MSGSVPGSRTWPSPRTAPYPPSVMRYGLLRRRTPPCASSSCSPHVSLSPTSGTPPCSTASTVCNTSSLRVGSRATPPPRDAFRPLRWPLLGDCKTRSACPSDSSLTPSMAHRPRPGSTARRWRLTARTCSASPQRTRSFIRGCAAARSLTCGVRRPSCNAIRMHPPTSLRRASCPLRTTPSAARCGIRANRMRTTRPAMRASSPCLSAVGGATSATHRCPSSSSNYPLRKSPIGGHFVTCSADCLRAFRRVTWPSAAIAATRSTSISRVRRTSGSGWPDWRSVTVTARRA